MTQNNLESTCTDLAGVRNTETNLEKAITTFEETSIVYTWEAFPRRWTNGRCGKAIGLVECHVFRIFGKVLSARNQEIRRILSATTRHGKVIANSRLPVLSFASSYDISLGELKPSGGYFYSTYQNLPDHDVLLVLVNPRFKL